MADFTYDGPPGAPTGRKLATATNWVGALVSLSLIGGVGVWGYKLLMRDVTGIPIVRAMEGPMRIAPEDPGGTLADHQGLAVNDVLGTGLAAPVPDRLLLAPKVTGLSDEDVPVAKGQDTRRNADRARPAIVAPTDAPALGAEQAPAAATAPPALPDDGSDPIQALANQIAADTKPFSDLAPGADAPVVTELEGDEADGTVLPEPDEEGEEVDVASLSPAPAGALIRSLRPLNRPNELKQHTLATPEAPAAPAGPTEIDPASLSAGTRLAQLGAYDSADTARKEWGRFSTRFGDFMEGKDMVIERATSGGRVFYRLRAHGFADLSDARRFCAAFVAENADCIPVTTR
ncbi:SPOR domain-containing protein [Salipiger sp.]|uniref:SPOR domain-containing protein n=1 Tax=Salipiger sp. TaxID=2078585 RepID=UPI003A969382